MLSVLNSDQFQNLCAGLLQAALPRGLFVFREYTCIGCFAALTSKGTGVNNVHLSTCHSPSSGPQPNEVWTWDIRNWPHSNGVFTSLYVVMDLFSRFIVAWMLSRKENSTLSTQLIAEASDRYGIIPGQLTLHQDRILPDCSLLSDLLGELSITASHSRPNSNDNPMSESQFKTMKYQPDYPRRFRLPTCRKVVSGLRTMV